MKNSQLAIEPMQRPSEMPRELDDAIRRRAYEIYEERQGMSGNAVDDWLQAEAEILRVEMEHEIEPEVEDKAA